MVKFRTTMPIPAVTTIALGRPFRVSAAATPGLELKLSVAAAHWLTGYTSTSCLYWTPTHADAAGMWDPGNASVQVITLLAAITSLSFGVCQPTLAPWVGTGLGCSAAARVAELLSSRPTTERET